MSSPKIWEIGIQSLLKCNQFKTFSRLTRTGVGESGSGEVSPYGRPTSTKQRLGSQTSGAFVWWGFFVDIINECFLTGKSSVKN